MKKILLRIIIIIVAIPTVTLGVLYATRGIPAVSKYVIKPMAQLSQSLGIPVIVMPSDNYFKQEAKERYEAAVNVYNNISNKEEIIINEERAKGYNSEGVSIYQNYNAGVSYAELQIKPYEQFEKEWVEYSKEFYKNSKKPTEEDIENAQKAVDEANTAMNQQEIETFNMKFKAYEGTQNGATVKSLIQSVKANNSNSEYHININENMDINSSQTYTITLQYGDDGRVTEIIIK